jgi:nucleoid-associated protein YgaU
MGAIKRYTRSATLNSGKTIGTGRAGIAIYRATQSGAIKSTTRQIKEGERLDIIAGTVYGDSSLWWVIAAASGIGWGLQVPAGVVITIPSDLNQVSLYVG